MRQTPATPPNPVIVCSRCHRRGRRAGYLILEIEGQWVRSPDICDACMAAVVEIRRRDAPPGGITKFVVEGRDPV